MLKAELHAHTMEDPRDVIPYSAKGLIRHLSKLGYSVLSITNHNRVTYSEELRKYALSHGITLIPGAELDVEGKHVLVYYVTQGDIEGIKTFEDLRKLKKMKRGVVVVAPHPFYPFPFCLHDKLLRHMDIFDAIEHSHLYTSTYNPNTRAARIARRHGKPLVATGDLHLLMQANKNFTYLLAGNSQACLRSAVKSGKLKIGSRPLKHSEFARISVNILSMPARRLFSKTI